MKKYFYLSAAALATLFATSCSSDDVPAPVDGDLTTFQVQVPEELATRFGEGTDATELYVAIYKQGQTNAAPLLTNFGGSVNPDLKIDPVTGASGKWTVSAPLVKNMHYDIVFWAQAPNAPFEFAPNTKTITVNYTGMENFQEARDAFFGQLKDFTSTGAINDNVTLTRPFSQINIGTADYSKYIAASGVTAPTFAMSVSGINNTLNLLSGEVGLDNSKLTDGQTLLTATSTLTAKNADDLSANNNSYSYLGMAYVLAGGADSQLTVDVNLYVNTLAGTFASYDNVPVQMNYRTNIYGDLLTNSETFNVEITPGFTGENNHEIVFSQEDLDKAMSEGKEDITLLPGEYVLKNSSMPQGKNFKIRGTDKEKTKLHVNASLYSENGGVSLENLTYTVPTGLEYNEFAFAFIQRVKNVEIKDCIIDGSLRLNLVNGGVANIENCTFNVSTESGFDGYGLYYYAATGSTVNVKNCVFNTQGKGIVMYNEGAQVYNCNVDGCKFISAVKGDKCAIQMHTERGISGTLRINNTTATGYADIHNGLWNELNNNTKVPTTKFNIFVDGTQVQTAE